IATDENGRVTFMNPVAEALTKWRFIDAKGSPVEAVFQVINEPDRVVLQNPVTRALEQHAVVKLGGSVLLVDRDGAMIPIDDTATPIIDSDGTVSGAVIAFRDIRE